MGKRSQIEPCHTQRTLLISEEICSKLYIIEIYEIMNTQYKTNGSIWSIWLSYNKKVIFMVFTFMINNSNW